jgi:hypothetical protein
VGPGVSAKCFLVEGFSTKKIAGDHSTECHVGKIRRSMVRSYLSYSGNIGYVFLRWVIVWNIVVKFRYRGWILLNDNHLLNYGGIFLARIYGYDHLKWQSCDCRCKWVIFGVISTFFRLKTNNFLK